MIFWLICLNCSNTSLTFSLIWIGYLMLSCHLSVLFILTCYALSKMETRKEASSKAIKLYPPPSPPCQPPRGKMSLKGCWTFISISPKIAETGLLDSDQEHRVILCHSRISRKLSRKSKERVRGGQISRMIERGMHLYLNFQLSSFVKLSDLYFDVAAKDAIKTIMASKKSMDAHEDMHVGQGN